MICFVKQKVMNYFLLRYALGEGDSRFKKEGWGIKCLIYAEEGTPDLGERWKKGTRMEGPGSESCPRPLVLKRGSVHQGFPCSPKRSNST